MCQQPLPGEWETGTSSPGCCWPGGYEKSNQFRCFKQRRFKIGCHSGAGEAGRADLHQGKLRGSRQGWLCRWARAGSLRPIAFLAPTSATKQLEASKSVTSSIHPPLAKSFLPFFPPHHRASLCPTEIP